MGFDPDDDDEDSDLPPGMEWYAERMAADEPVVKMGAVRAVLGRLHEMLPARAASRRDRKVMYGALSLNMLCDVIYLNAAGFENRFAATQFARYAWIVGHCCRIDENEARRALVEAAPGLFGPAVEEQRLKDLFLSPVLQFDPHEFEAEEDA